VTDPYFNWHPIQRSFEIGNQFVPVIPANSINTFTGNPPKPAPCPVCGEE
jgi:hypothetical protein